MALRFLPCGLVRVALRPLFQYRSSRLDGTQALGRVRSILRLLQGSEPGRLGQVDASAAVLLMCLARVSRGLRDKVRQYSGR